MGAALHGLDCGIGRRSADAGKKQELGWNIGCGAGAPKHGPYWTGLPPPNWGVGRAAGL